jgi:hypothetical protein
MAPYAVGIGGGNTELGCCKVVQVKDLSQLVDFIFNLKFVFIPLYQENLNIAVSGVV